MHKATLEQWRMFCAVVDHGGFSQAGQAIHKSQSSIHHAVQKLENSLSLKLLVVKGRKAQLTQAGELMLRRARYLLDEAGKLEAIGQSLSEGTENLIKVAVDEVFPSTVLYEALDAVSEEYPLLRIELLETVLGGAREMLSQGQVDLAISPTPLDDGFSETLCHIEFVAVAHPDHSLHQMDRELTFEDLKSCRQIVVRDSSSGRGLNVGWLGANQRWTVSHLRTSIDMISKGFGFAWLPHSEIRAELQQGLLKPLPLARSATRLEQLYLLFSDADRLGPAARTFIGHLRYHCEPEQVNSALSA